MTNELIEKINAMSLDELYDLGDYISCVKKKKRRDEEREEARERSREEINRKNNNHNTRARARGSFVPPTLEEVTDYCKQNNKVDPIHFHSYYEANGWKVGRVTMKDWKAAVRTWERMSAERQARAKRFNRSGGWTPPPINEKYLEAQREELRKAGLI